MYNLIIKFNKQYCKFGILIIVQWLKEKKRYERLLNEKDILFNYLEYKFYNIEILDIFCFQWNMEKILVFKFFVLDVSIYFYLVE